ncbi:unnamed protein product [Arctogadus glacialis]
MSQFNNLCSVCVEDVSAASPGPSQSDWPLGLSEAAHLVCFEESGSTEPAILRTPSPHRHVESPARQ